MLTNDTEFGAFVAAFRTDIAEAEAKLVDAAQNITYGDAEKTPDHHDHARRRRIQASSSGRRAR